MGVCQHNSFSLLIEPVFFSLDPSVPVTSFICVCKLSFPIFPLSYFQFFAGSVPYLVVFFPDLCILGTDDSLTFASYCPFKEGDLDPTFALLYDKHASVTSLYNFSTVYRLSPVSSKMLHGCQGTLSTMSLNFSVSNFFLSNALLMAGGTFFLWCLNMEYIILRSAMPTSNPPGLSTLFRFLTKSTSINCCVYAIVIRGTLRYAAAFPEKLSFCYSIFPVI